MIVVNLYGGPGTGKSTTAAAIFSMLKQRGINAEYVPEFAKDLTWHGRQETLRDQIYVLGKQQHKLFMLKDQVDVIVTDSPVLLTLHYGKGGFPSLLALAVDVYNSYTNHDIFLVRSKAYNPKGRNQTEEEAREIDRDILEILKTFAGDFFTSDTSMASYEAIVEDIIARLQDETLR